MIIKYDEKKFIKSVVNEYILYSHDDYKSQVIFEKYYNKLLERFDINNLFHYYLKDFNINIKDAINYYETDYIKIKLGIILHMKVITYIIDDYYNNYDSDYFYV
jgi:hypothetical protein